MDCAKRVSVYALYFGLFVFASSYTAKAGSGAGSKINYATTASESSPVLSEFGWKEHKTLSWDDFRGPVNAASGESAAATHCGMGFRTNTQAPGKPEVIVYNKFYVNRSWVRNDAHLPEILFHEQGHFDLCELYTRKLKKRMDAFNFATAVNVRQELYNIYTEVNDEYESRQQAYEHETAHGTITSEQKRWADMIAFELKGAAAGLALAE